jgi:hypothetical protein
MIFLGVPLRVWARGVINPGYLVVEVLMQKTLSLRYTSKLKIYGLFLCFGRRSSGKSGAKGLKYLKSIDSLTKSTHHA